MTKKELLTKLLALPEGTDNMEVFIAERKTDFKYGLVNSVSIKEINFMEDSDGKVLCRDKVIVLDEE